MEFLEELARHFPEDIPERAAILPQAARHLELIVEANRHFNLTRILSPGEAVIKHVIDSVLPWRLFAGARQILDAGTGAGFPGIPLALVFPDTRLILSESIGKKARFVQSSVQDLGLPNVVVTSQRAEELLRVQTADIITARAVAPIPRALDLFGPVLKNGSRLLLYKGPDAADEIAAAHAQIRKHRVRVQIVQRYELPDSLGSRTIVEVSR